MTMLRQDAETNCPPGHVLTLTSREWKVEAEGYRRACQWFWRAFRRRWGRSVEYCGFVEWTTGEGPRSGGRRRLHSHWLLKGLDVDDLAAVERWAAAEWRKLTGAWVVQLAELRTVGGVVGYLALHHEKMEQAPPEGWTGRRLRPSAGYFAESGRVRREKARVWLQEHRWRQAGLDEGGMLAAAARRAPRVVWGLTEWEKEARAAIALGPGRSFDSLPARRELDRQLARARALGFIDQEEDEMARRKSSHQGERSPFADAERRRWSPVARLEVCPECGSHEGRHLRVCSRRSAAPLSPERSGDASG